jgi:hypothetical protein
MTLTRQLVGVPELYRGSLISVRFLGPDFLCYVGDIEMSGFYISPAAAAAAGQRYINDEIDAKEKSQAKGKK